MQRVAVVGATGAVGREMLAVLEEREFPIGRVRCLASSRSAGETISVAGEQVIVEELTPTALLGNDIYLFSAGAAISREYAPIAAADGVVIDNSSAWRMDPSVPLVVPEVNPDDVHGHSGIIANPNCSTIQLVVALKPLDDAVGVMRVIVATYQSVSGTGREAIAELTRQTDAALRGEPSEPVVYPHPIAFNLFPHIDVFLENGVTKEEQKMVDETRKIMHRPDLAVSATCVRVPVYRAHSEAVVVELRSPITVDDARRLWERAPGVVLDDDPTQNEYPTPKRAEYTDPCFVGRVRRDDVFENGLAFFIVADNLRKGAALNAVQIAELLIA